MTKSKVWFLRRRRSHDLDMIRTAIGLELPAESTIGRETLSLSHVAANPNIKKQAGLKPSDSFPGATSLGAGTGDQSAPATFASRWGRSQTAPSAPLREIFTPTRPKHSAALFSGRGEQLRRIISGVEDQQYPDLWRAGERQDLTGQCGSR